RALWARLIRWRRWSSWKISRVWSSDFNRLLSIDHNQNPTEVGTPNSFALLSPVVHAKRSTAYPSGSIWRKIDVASHSEGGVLPPGSGSVRHPSGCWTTVRQVRGRIHLCCGARPSFEWRHTAVANTDRERNPDRIRLCAEHLGRASGRRHGASCHQ